MATINIVDVSTITPFMSTGAITTGNTEIVDVASEYCAKINSLWIANIDGTNSATVTVSVSADNGSNYYAIASTIAVPADATLVLIDKTNSIYLDETDLLRVTASANGDLTYTVSGELMTD